MRTQTETRRRTGEPGFSSRPPHGLPPLLDASASHPGLMLYTGDCDDALLGRAFRQGGTPPGGPALRQWLRHLSARLSQPALTSWPCPTARHLDFRMPTNTVRREVPSALTLGQSSGGCGQWRTPAPQGQYGTPAPWASRPWNRHVRPRALKPKMASARTRRRGGGRRATGPMHTVRTYALVPRHVTPARPCGIFLNSQTLNINCKLARPPCGWCGRRLRSCFSVAVYGVVAGSAPQACRKHGVRELATPGLAPHASRRESTTSLAPGCKRPASPCPSGRT